MYNHYSSGKEFIFNIMEYIGQANAQKLYLLSSTPFALYVSATTYVQSDAEKAKKLLNKIENTKEFPFYYYRLAKIYEKEDMKKAFELHKKAVEENNKLADFALGRYGYTGMYPNTNINFMKNDDEIVWVGNISEKFSTLGIIHPIRSWKKSRDFIYAVPYPSDEALKIYEEREKETYKTKPFEISKELILKGLIDSGFNELQIIGVDKEKYKSVFSDLEITIKDQSENLLIIGEFEKNYDMSKILKKAKKVLAFVYVPDLNDRENNVWSAPNFRILRTTKQIVKLFENQGFEVKKIKALKKDLRGILVKKG
jgi:hypothetical protein